MAYPAFPLRARRPCDPRDAAFGRSVSQHQAPQRERRGCNQLPPHGAAARVERSVGSPLTLDAFRLRDAAIGEELLHPRLRHQIRAAARGR
eukprot:2532445-Prymnesium_polylepis.2